MSQTTRSQLLYRGWSQVVTSSDVGKLAYLETTRLEQKLGRRTRCGEVSSWSHLSNKLPSPTAKWIVETDNRLPNPCCGFVGLERLEPCWIAWHVHSNTVTDNGRTTVRRILVKIDFRGVELEFQGTRRWEFPEFVGQIVLLIFKKLCCRPTNSVEL